MFICNSAAHLLRYYGGRSATSPNLGTRLTDGERAAMVILIMHMTNGSCHVHMCLGRCSCSHGASARVLLRAMAELAIEPPRSSRALAIAIATGIAGIPAVLHRYFK